MTHHKMFKRGVLRGGSALSALAMLGAGLATTAVMAPAPAAAQDYTRGTLQGTILTSAGEPMAGATVTLSSNEQGFSRTTTTDATGGFRFALLPTGSYTLRAEGPEGETVNDPNVPIVAGQANTFTYTAAAGGAPAATAAADEEAIVITGTRVQTADFGATQTGVTIDVQSLVESVPIPRTQTGLILVAPGTTQGDSNFNDCVDCVSIGGATIAENSYYVNGLNTTNFRTLVGNNTVPFEFYRTFEVKTGGYSAEFGRALGGVTSAVTKSGSNSWEAGAVVAWQPSFLYEQSPNTLNDAEGNVKNRNQDDLREIIDANFYLSGPIIKDRLFFYGLYNPRWVKQEDTVQANGLRYVDRTNDPFFGAKVDAIITDGHRLEGTWFYDKRTRNVDFINVDPDGNQLDRAGREVATSGGHNWIVQYTGDFTDWFTLSAAYGENNFARSAVSSEERPIVQSTLDGVRLINGLPLTAGNPTDSQDKRTIYRVDADFYVNLFGSHHFRLGYDREDLNSLESTFYTADYAYVLFRAAEEADADDTNTYIRRRLYLNSGEFTSRQTAFYIQDDWDLFNERLNLQLGLRNDNYRNSSVEGTVYLNQKNQWAPRLGASFDVFGDKRTRVRAFYGKYYLGVPTNTNIRLAGQELYYEQRFAYPDGVNPFQTNGLGVPDGLQFDANGAPMLGGLVGVRFDCPDVSPDAGEGCRTIFSDGVLGPTDTLVAEDLNPMFQDEIILGASHRMNDWTFGLNYTRRRLKETLEDVAIDAAVLAYCEENGVVGCEDSFTGFHQYVLANPGSDITVRLDGDCEVDARQCEVVTLSAQDLGYPKPVRKYDALEFTAKKAFNGLYALDFSYTWAKVRGNYEGSVKSDNNQDDAGLTQDFDQPGLTHGAYGILANERKHTFKFFGFIKPKEWLSIGANVVVQSPRNFSCIGVHPTDDFASAYAAASFWCSNPMVADKAVEEVDGNYLVPRGTAFKGGWFKNLDLGVQFELPGALSGSSFRIDVFNVFNWKSKLDFVEFDNNNGTPREDYAFVTGYQAPRAVRLTWALRFGGDQRRVRNPVVSSGQ